MNCLYKNLDETQLLDVIARLGDQQLLDLNDEVPQDPDTVELWQSRQLVQISDFVQEAEVLYKAVGLTIVFEFKLIAG